VREWKAWLAAFLNSVVLSEPIVEGELPNISAAVERARRDWLAAQTYFQSVSDPELVDHAIHLVEAAERKYIYLLRQARLDAALAGPTAWPVVSNKA